MEAAAELDAAETPEEKDATAPPHCAKFSVKLAFLKVACLVGPWSVRIARRRIIVMHRMQNELLE